MKRYERYREISLPWLHSIPDHWNIMRNKNFLFEVKDEVGDNYNQYDLLSLTKQGVILRDMEEGKGKFPKDFKNYVKVSPGNLIFCLFDIDETPRTVGLSSYKGMITGAYTVFNVKNIGPRYLLYYYLSLDDSKSLKPYYSGLRKTIRADRFLSINMPLPPQSEQEQIVRFLDGRLALIDKYVKEKEREVELLKELKNAEINRTVTKGLNPDAEMKDSRVEWIGNTPKHWNDLSLSQCVFEQCISNKDVHHQNLLSLSYGQIVRKDINKTDGLLPSSFDTYQVVNKGNIVLRLTDLQNDKKSLRTGIANETGIVTSAYLTLNCYEHINPEYLHYILHCYDLRKVFYGLGGGLRQNCTFREIRKLVIYRPPLSEQHAIVAYIQQMEERINKAIASIEREIGLVKEYKTRLVSDVVTGKVDVRDINVPKE